MRLSLLLLAAVLLIGDTPKAPALTAEQQATFLSAALRFSAAQAEEAGARACAATLDAANKRTLEARDNYRAVTMAVLKEAGADGTKCDIILSPPKWVAVIQCP